METELIRECPSCGEKKTYQSKTAFKRGVKDNAKCNSCKTIFRKPNIISELTEQNKYDYSSGEIIRYIYSFPRNRRETVAIQILKLCNPNIDYKILGKISRTESNIQYTCTIHPHSSTITTFRHIVERQQGCRECKGQKPQGYWDKDNNLKDAMTQLVMEVYNKTSCVFTLSTYFTYNSVVTNAWFNKLKTPSEDFYQLINELNLPSPKTHCYIKDCKIFRGFFEFVGYCLISKWGVPFDYSPLVFEKYYSDGYFSDLKVHWEHWGGLNKNNKLKKQLYEDANLGLFETYDEECQEKGISHLYKSLRNFFISNGYEIPEMSNDEVLDVVVGGMTDYDTLLDTVLTIIKDNEWDKKIVETELRQTKDGIFILSFINKFHNHSILDFKQHLNNKHGFNYSVTAKRGSYKNYDYFVEQIKPFIEEFGYIPTQEYFTKINRTDIVNMFTRLAQGPNNLKRNQIEEGKYYYLVKDLYLSEPPYDRQLIWDGDVNYHNNVLKVLNYFKSLNLPFPKVMNEFRHNPLFSTFGPSLHSAISRNGGWEVFVSKYSY